MVTSTSDPPAPRRACTHPEAWQPLHPACINLPPPTCCVQVMSAAQATRPSYAAASSPPRTATSQGLRPSPIGGSYTAYQPLTGATPYAAPSRGGRPSTDLPVPPQSHRPSVAELESPSFGRRYSAAAVLLLGCCWAAVAGAALLAGTGLGRRCLARRGRDAAGRSAHSTSPTHTLLAHTCRSVLQREMLSGQRQQGGLISPGSQRAEVASSAVQGAYALSSYGSAGLSSQMSQPWGETYAPEAGYSTSSGGPPPPQPRGSFRRGAGSLASHAGGGVDGGMEQLPVPAARPEFVVQKGFVTGRCGTGRQAGGGMPACACAFGTLALVCQPPLPIRTHSWLPGCLAAGSSFSPQAERAPSTSLAADNADGQCLRSHSFSGRVRVRSVKASLGNRRQRQREEQGGSRARQRPNSCCHCKAGSLLTALIVSM
jgi:hypothetical protein